MSPPQKKHIFTKFGSFWHLPKAPKKSNRKKINRDSEMFLPEIPRPGWKQLALGSRKSLYFGCVWKCGSNLLIESILPCKISSFKQSHTSLSLLLDPEIFSQRGFTIWFIHSYSDYQQNMRCMLGYFMGYTTKNMIFGVPNPCCAGHPCWFAEWKHTIWWLCNMLTVPTFQRISLLRMISLSAKMQHVVTGNARQRGGEAV